MKGSILFRLFVAILPALCAGLAQQSAPAGRHEPPGIAPPATQPPARLVVEAPLAEQLARGLVVIEFHTENLRIVPVYGAAALSVTPRIGHLHITVDDSSWHWVHPSEEPVIVQGLTPGKHRVLLELADPTHKVIDSHSVSFEIPQR
jgi:hypothetical protein